MLISQLLYSIVFSFFIVLLIMKLFGILLTGLLLFSALYAPQPVYPVLIAQFGIEATDVALLQTATFIPLALSPVFYGFIIDKTSPLKVLRISLLLIAVGEFFFAFSTSFLYASYCQILSGFIHTCRYDISRQLHIHYLQKTTAFRNI